MDKPNQKQYSRATFNFILRIRRYPSMLETHLQKYFSYSTFRPGQKEIVESIMAGRDVVALMPTGGGKSLCFQLPALLSDKPSLIISPLIALMKDQVDALNARGIAATYLNSSLTPQEAGERMETIRAGKIKIVYVAPERLSNSRFRAEMASLDLYMVAVDEAHCVSAWGHDFRPDYLLIHEFLALCKPRPIVAAFTATATPEVAEDIRTRLELRDPAIYVRGFDRPNLQFFVRSGIPHKNRLAEATRIISATKGAAVAYTLSRKGAEELAQYLVKNGVSAAAYHAGLSTIQRSKIQEHFMENRFKVIVATIAFGMGIDKADIRLVLHVGVPASLEGYYQEAGRAGRDGEKAFCILLPTGRDMSMHHFFIQKNVSEMESFGKDPAEIRRVTNIKYDRLEKVKQYADASTCRRRKILEYFADPDLAKYAQNCGGCDVCLNYVWKQTPRVATTEADDEGALTGTVRDTIGLYEQKHTAEQIAKIRGLGISTIWGHLIKWYQAGGNLPVEKYITPEQEKRIMAAVARGSREHFFSSVKAQLPSDISYEQIRLVLAKRRRAVGGVKEQK